MIAFDLSHRTWYQFLLRCLILLGSTNNCLASDQKWIEWGLINLPPYHIITGKQEGQGTYDKILSLLKERLPQYQHRHKLYPNPKRVLTAMEQQKNICYLGLAKNRSRFGRFLFSEVMSYEPYPKLMYQAKHQLAIDPYISNNVLNLKRLLIETNLTLGLNAGQSYGYLIDRLHQNGKQVTKNIVLRAGKDNKLGMMELFKADRVQLMLVQPPELLYLDSLQTKDYRTVSVYGSGFVKSYVACSHSDFGKEVMVHIDRILRTNRLSVAYQTIISSFLKQETKEELLKSWKIMLEHSAH